MRGEQNNRFFEWTLGDLVEYQWDIIACLCRVNDEPSVTIRGLHETLALVTAAVQHVKERRRYEGE